jgi:hypothetical protein
MAAVRHGFVTRRKRQDRNRLNSGQDADNGPSRAIDGRASAGRELPSSSRPRRKDIEATIEDALARIYVILIGRLTRKLARARFQ